MLLKKILTAAALSAVFAVNAQSFTIATDKGASPVYRTDEDVVFIFRLTDKDGAPVSGAKLKYTLLRDGASPEKGELVTGKEFARVRAKQSVPGWLRVEAVAESASGEPFTDAKGKAAGRKCGGAMIAPERIRQGMEEPAGFDAFLNELRAELASVPMKAEQKSLDLRTAGNGKLKHFAEKVECLDVKIECAGGKPVSGYLAKPRNAAKGSLPAIVFYHPAGVRSATAQAGFGAKLIAFDVNAHGLPNGMPDAFYSALCAPKGELNSYFFRNSDDRGAYYFRGMFLRVLRALEYVRSLPEWNGKDLIVAGYSQGGAQALFAAAADPKVTLCSAACPALCDLGGCFAGRRSGWIVNARVKDGKPADARSAKIFAETAFYDNANYAKRIGCETYISTSCLDSVCPPSSVYAAFNNIPSSVKKELFLMDQGGHWNFNPPGTKRINAILNAPPKPGK